MEYHSRYYNVHAISIMPNHVHMLLDTSNQISNDELIEHVPDNFVDVGNWMQLIKGGSAFQINKYLGRSGKLWAKESFDHYVRFNKEGEYERIKDYILQNPIKAGLGIKYRKKPFLYSI
ncbi:transposase [Portibacter lacus]|uniref:Transposase IS200-like domain-containing protein n=1 Tax=Portibacter lacus TaxID=1099794 RepID=A0AA37SPX2_9BACT|nr:transposase [Portibacter lacus]GLR17079.1 hypothetical protein GCM10007940_16940 [Portibacter lacus]